MSNNDRLVLSKQNYQIIGVGFAIVVLGYFLMSGGGSPPDEFVYEEIFSPIRITVAPIVCLLGFGVVMYGIMKKEASEKES